MAVIQISKIQVRRGLQENLPQLSSAELAWSIDQRRLFIGNGTLGEGAPSIGNTEILTEHSDILSIIASYTFKGAESGFTSQTGPGLLSPIVRTIQNKFDEQISVRDFGVTGDGVTDDTLAFLRAIQQIYPTSQSTNVKVRRIIYVPAGTYIISDELPIPPYAKIVGDGIDSTIIKQVNSTARSVFTFADDAGNISPSIGAGSANPPVYQIINDMTLWNSTDNDVVYIDSVNGLRFLNVKFKGSQLTPTTSGTSKTLVRILSNYTASKNISMYNCDFYNSTYAVIATNNVYGVSIGNSNFDTLYNGVSANGSTYYPRSIRITGSIFDNIAHNALLSYGNSNIVSAYNYYKSVGNGLSSSPVSSILYFENPNNYSLSDEFDRSNFDATIQPRVTTTGTFSSNLITLNASGSLKSTPGATEIISASSTLSNTSLVISSVSTSNAIIDYNLSTGGNVRTGTLTISINTTSLNQFYYEDSFNEYPAGTQYQYGTNSPVGTELTFVAYGNSIILAANTSSTSGNVTLKYNVRQFN